MALWCSAVAVAIQPMPPSADEAGYYLQTFRAQRHRHRHRRKRQPRQCDRRKTRLNARPRGSILRRLHRPQPPQLPRARHLASAPLHDYDILPLELTRLTDVRAFAAALNARVAVGELPSARSSSMPPSRSIPRKHGQTLLTLLLLQSMDRHEGRIVVLGSLSHDPSAPFNKMAFKDLKWRTFFPDGTSTEAIAKGTWSTNPVWSGGLRRYAVEALPDNDDARPPTPPLLPPPQKHISILGVDPGTLSNTTLLRRGPWFMHFFPALRTAGKSAGDVVRAAFGDFGEERPDGWYFDGSKKAEMSAEARDEQKQEMLWRDTVGYVRLEEGETMLGDWK
ncbi:hypothetical protein B0H14DRAFT_3661714 [Mycena olivaceomarginata]|nr:hypothetical protein B0H14DRAFT_3661714 [Mycena olivaceomarginata]